MYQNDIGHDQCMLQCSMLANLNHVRTVEIALILEMDLHAHVVTISVE